MKNVRSTVKKVFSLLYMPALTGVVLLFSTACNPLVGAGSSSKIDSTFMPGVDPTLATSINLLSPTNFSTINNTNVGTFTVNGTCAINNATVTITLTDVNLLTVTATPICNGSTFSTTMSTVPLTNGVINLYAVLKASGYYDATATVTFNKLTTPPAVTITSPTTLTYINSANKTAFAIQGTCTATAGNVSIAVGAVHGTAACAGGAFSGTLDVHSLADGAVTATASQTDVSSVTTTVSVNFTKDTTPPSIAITSAPNYIYSGNKTAYVVSGTCSDAGSGITGNVSVAISDGTNTKTGTSACGSGTFSVTLNTTTSTPSAFGDGSNTLTITASLSDGATNTNSATATRSQDLTSPILVIGSAPAFINNTNKNAYVVSGTCSDALSGIFGNVTVSVGDGTNSKSGTSTCSGGNYSVTLDTTSASPGSLANGSITVTASDNDVAGNTKSATSTTTKNTTGPIVGISSPTTGSFINIANKAAFNVSGTCTAGDGNISVGIGSVNGTTACTGGGTFTTNLDVHSLSDGAVTATISQTDLASNTSTASVNFTKDTVAPVITFSSPTVSSYITASSASSYSVSGTCTTGDGNVSISIGSVNGSGACLGGVFSGSLDVHTLSDGAVTATITQTDAAGNSSTISVNFNKDTVAPAIAITSAPSYINVANKAAYAVAGTCADVGGSGISGTVSVTIGDGVNSKAATGACAAGAFNISVDTTSSTPGALTEGNNNITVTANVSDAATNSNSASVTKSKDTIIPALAITSAPTYIYSGNKTAYTVVGTCSDTTSGISGNVSITVTDGTNSKITSGVCAAGAFTINVDTTASTPGALTDGANNITITANVSDTATNSNSTSVTRSKDSTPPSIAITSVPSYINVANKAAYVVAGTCTDATSGISGNVSVVVTDGTNSKTTTGTCGGGTYSISVDTTASTPGPLADGANNITITASVSDAATNTNSASSTKSKGTTAPVLSFTAPTTSSYINIANKTSFIVSGACITAAGTVSVSIGSVNGTTACAANAFSTALDVHTLSDGAVTATISQTDTAGNLGSTSVNFNKDTVAPVIAISTPITSTYITVANTSSFSVNGTCTTGDGNVSISIGSINGTGACAGGVFSGTLDTHTLSDGAVTATITQTDAAGNASTTSVNFNKDTVLPTLSIATPAGGAYANSSNYTAFTVSGNCSANIAGQSLTLAAGSVNTSVACGASNPYAYSTTLNLTPLSDGPVTITANITDSHGNAAVQASVSITKDIIAPAVTGLTWTLTPASGAVSSSATPNIAVTSAEANSTLNVFTASSCTTSLGNGTINGSGAGNASTSSLAGEGTKSFWFTLTDSAGNTTACTTTGLSYYLAFPPALTTPIAQVFSSTQVAQGAAITPLDWNNGNIGSDLNMTYSCAFDRVVDGSASSGSDCSLLPGTPSFSTSAGTLSWTPNTVAWGPYEICVTGTNVAGNSTTCTVVDVKLPYTTTNLLSYFDAAFSNHTNGGNGSNGAAWGAQDLTSGTALTLTNFAKTTSSGYAGSLPNLSASEKLTPYALVFDGVDDTLTMGTANNGQSGFAFDAWISPLAATGTKKVIVSNADSTGKGFTLSQNLSGDGKLQLTLGQRSFEDEVRALNPLIYYRFNEVSGSTAIDSGSMGLNAAYTNTYLEGGTSPVADGTTSVSFTATSNATVNTGNKVLDEAPYTVCAWVKPTAIAGANYIIANGGETAGAHGYALIKEINQYEFWVSSNTGQIKGHAVIPVTNTNWAFLCGSWDGTTNANAIKINRDGGSVMGYATAANGAVNASTRNTYLAGTSTGAVTWDGSLDEIAVFGSVIGDTAVSTLYNAAVRPTCRSRSTLANNYWYDIGGLFTGGNSLSLFVNGVQECSVTATSTYNTSTSAITLGTDTSGANAWSGSIGEFRLYNSSATASTLTSNYTATKQRYQDTPEKINNLVFWFNPESITGLADGASISSMTDQSSNGYTMSQAGATRPTWKQHGLNSRPTIAFNGSQYLPSNYTPGTLTSLSTYTVGKFPQVGAGNYEFIFDTSNGGTGSGFGATLEGRSSQNFAGLFSKTIYYGKNNAYSSTAFNALGFTYTSGAIKHYLNGADQTPYDYYPGFTTIPASLTSSGNHLTVGSRSDTLLGSLTGELAEFFIYNSVLSSTDRAQLEQYLQRRYNIPTSNATPATTITTPLASNYINSVNNSSFTAGGACNYAGQTVSLSYTDGTHTVNATANCNGTTYSSTGVDLSTMNAGAVTLTVSMPDPYGYTSNISTVSVTKDITAPVLTGLGWTLSPTNGSVSASATPNVAITGAEASSTLKIYGSGTCTTSLGSVALNGSGAGNVTSSALSGEGTKSLWFTLTDLAGNPTACTSTGLSYYLAFPPALTTPIAQVYTSTQVAQGSAITSLDWNNGNIGSDLNMSYACAFDRVVDGSAASGSDCSLLPGTPSFSTSAGTLSWTPNTVAWGPYEICVTGTNVAGNSTTCTVVDVKLPYTTTNLLTYFDAAFSNSTNGGNGSNGAAWGAEELVGGSALTLSNFAKTTSSGYTGSLPNLSTGEKATPYNLVFDGVDDTLTMGTGNNGQSGFAFDTWVSPIASTGASKVIASNADTSGKGFTLAQSYSGDASLQLTLGQKTYVDELLSDSPTYYFRGNEKSGTVANNANIAGVNGTYVNTTAYSVDSPIKDNMAGSIYYNKNGDVNIASSAGLQSVLASGASWSVETWIKATTLPAPGYWSWIWSKAYTSHVSPYYEKDLMLNNDGSLLAAVYLAAGGVKISAATAAGTIVAGNWYHVVTTYNDTTGNLNVFVNGTSAGSGTNAAGAITSYATPFTFAEDDNLKNNTHYSFNGNLSEMAIYPTALSGARITGHYNAATRPTCRTRSTLANNYWYNIGALFTGGNTLSLLVNGVQECSITQAATYNTSTASLTLGTSASGANAWNGGMGEFRLYNSSATVSTITTNYNATYLRYNDIPQAIGSLAAWFKADSLALSDGNAVSAWSDSSTSANNATQATGADQPVYKTNILNGKPAVRFNGSTNFISVPLAASNYADTVPFSLFSVFTPNGITQVPIAGTGNTGLATFGSVFGNVNTINTRIQNETSFADNYAPMINHVAQEVGVTRTAANLEQVYSNGVSLGSNTRAGQYRLDSIGARNGGTAPLYFNGDIGEVLYYSIALSSTQRTQLEQYFQRRYILPLTTLAPTLTVTSPIASGYINAGNYTAFVANGNCNYGGENVALSYTDGTHTVNTTAVCNGSNYTTSAIDLSSLNSGAVTLTVSTSDIYGYTPPATVVSLTKDIVVPTVTITTPLANTFINNSNVTAYTVSGACSVNGLGVHVAASGGATVSNNVTCTAGAYTISLNLSTLSSGSVIITSTQTTTAGNVGLATVTVTDFGIPAVANSTFLITPNSVIADGSTTSAITITMKDSSGNPVQSQVVTLTSSRNATDTIATVSGTTNASGVATFTILSSTTGNPTLTASADGGSLTQKMYFLSQTPSVDFQASLATLGNSAGTSALGTWKDSFQSATTNDFTINGSDTSWSGTGANTNATTPYQLAFNGSSQYLKSTTTLNSTNGFYFETWAQPTSATTLGSVILNTADASHGFQLKQSSIQAGQVELKLSTANTYAEAVMADSPVGYWRLGDAPGSTTAINLGSAGSSANGTYTNGPGRGIVHAGAADGWVDNDTAANFTGTSYVSIPEVAALDILGQSTGQSVESWIYFTGAPGANQNIVSVNAGGGKCGFDFYVVTSTQFRFSDNCGHAANFNYTFNTGQWYHVVATVGSGASSPESFYVNGTQVGSTTNASATWADNTGWGTINIGYISSWSAQFPGYIDDVAIYNTALTPTQVANHYNARTTPVCRSISTLANNVWDFISGQYTPNSKALQLFVNGTQECLVTLPSSTTTNGSTAPLAAAAQVTSGGVASNYWTGTLGEVRASNVGTLATSDVINHYNAESGNYPSFAPTGISNLALWYDANDITTLYQNANCTSSPVTSAGQTVACWKDKSGHAVNLNATYTTSPTYDTSAIGSQNAIRFGQSGLNGLYSSTNTAITNYTNFLVTRIRGNPVGTATAQTAFFIAASPWDEIVALSGGNWELSQGGAAVTGIPAAGNQLITATSSGGAGYIGINGYSGVTPYSGLSGTAINNEVNVGSNGVTGLNGDIAEVITYSSVLTPTQIKQVEAYLNTKYGGFTPSTPSTPTDVAGNTQLAVSWTADTNAASYTIERSTSSSGPFTEVATGITGTSWTDTSVANDTTYYYVVVGDDAIGRSTASTNSTANESYGNTSATTSSILITPDSLIADGSTTASVTVTLKDSAGQLAINQAVTLTSSRGATDTIATVSGTTNASGQATFTIKSSTTGNPTLTASGNSGSLTSKMYFLSQSPTVDFQAGLATLGVSAGTSALSTWKDLKLAATTNDFTIFGSDTSWSGTGANTNATTPYQLAFNGTSQYLKSTTTLNSTNGFYFETWVKPTSASTLGSVILNTADASHGFQLKQSSVQAGQVELKLSTANSYAEAVLADSPSGYWRLGEVGSTKTAVNIGSTGATINGTYTNGPTLSTIHAGASDGWADNDTAATFASGSTTSVIIPNDSSITPSGTSMSVDFWINPTSFTDSAWVEKGLIGCAGGCKQQWYIRYLNGTGKIDLSYVNAAHWYEIMITPAAAGISTGTWSHVAMTFDSSTNTLSLYVNGSLVTSTTADAGPGVYAQNSVTMSIGGNPYETYFNGSIDDVAFYNSALSAARVSAHYAARSVPVCRSVSSLTNNSWSFLAGSFNPNTYDLQLFVNGTQECSLTLPSATATNGSAAPLAAAAQVTSGGVASNYWTGTIGEVRSSNTGTIQTSDVINHYNAESANYPTFTPASIANNILWLDGNDLTTLYQTSDCSTTAVSANNQPVGCWKDKSGNGFNATQATNAQRPTYTTNQINSKPVLNFVSGNSATLGVGTALGKPANFTSFVVFNTSDVTTQQAVMGSSQNGGANITDWGFVGIAMGNAPAGAFMTTISDGTNTSIARSPALLSNNTYAMIGQRYTAGQALVDTFVNGSAYTNTPWTGTAVSNGGTAYAFALGQCGAYASRFLNGNIAEVIIYNTALTNTQIEQVQAYLNTKYNFTPATVTGVADTGGTSQVAVSWTADPNATTYTVERGTSAGGPFTEIASAVSGTSFTDTTAVNGTTYYYVVTANDFVGTSSNSSSSNATPMALATGFSLNPASGSTSNNSAPVVTATIPAADVGIGATLNIYSATGCSTSLGSASITSTSQNVTLAISSNAAYSFYYTISDTNGVTACTTTGLTYTFNNTLALGNWDFGTPASYTLSNSSLLDFNTIGGKTVCELTPTTFGDSTNSNYNAGTGYGITFGTLSDGSSSGIKLGSGSSCNGTSTNCNALNSSWAPQWSHLVGLWHLDETSGNFVDSSNSGNNLTPTSVTQGSSGQLANAATFNGSAYATTNINPANLSIGTQSWTMSSWVYCSAIPSSSAFYMSRYGDAGNDVSILWINSGTGYPTIYIRDSAGNIGTYTGTSNVCDSRWHLVTGVLDRTSQLVKLYQDGVLVGTPVTAASIGAITDTAKTFTLGATYQYGTWASYFTGSLDEAAVWNTALSSAEIANIYNIQSPSRGGSFISRVSDAITSQTWTNFFWTPTLPFNKELPDSATSETTTNYTSLSNSSLMSNNIALYHLDGTGSIANNATFADSSGNSNTLTVSNAGGTGFTYSVAKLNAGILYDGTDDYASRAALTGLNSQGAFTLSYWYKRGATTQTCYVGQYLDSNNRINVGQWNDGNIYFNMSGGSNSYGLYALNDTAWHHVAMVFDGSQSGNSGRLKGFLDGTQITLSYTGTIPTTTSNMAGGVFQIGKDPASGGYSGCTADEIGIWNRALAGTEITQLYQRAASRIKFQIKSCTANDCSDNTSWIGPDGTANTYFSELDNMSTQAAAPSGSVKATLPNMSLASFTSPPSANRYFQYRAVLESDSTTTTLMPEIKTTSIGPFKYDTSSPSIIGNTSFTYKTITNYIESLGTGGCSSGITYNVSNDKVTWYYYNSGWVAANGTNAQANSASTIASHIANFGTPGPVYIKAYLNSTGNSACELDNIEVDGSF